MASKFWPYWIMVGIGIPVFFAGYWLISQNSVEVEVIEASQNQNVVIDIGGAVVKPGVYELKHGSRLKDVVVLAQGLSADADREVFDKSFNMAEVLKDGEKIYIPSKSGEIDVIGTQDSGLISVNRASKEALMTLPGIGESRATKIIEGRPYKSLEELVERKSLSSSLFEEIKSKLVLW